MVWGLGPPLADSALVSFREEGLGVGVSRVEGVRFGVVVSLFRGLG